MNGNRRGINEDRDSHMMRYTLHVFTGVCECEGRGMDEEVLTVQRTLLPHSYNRYKAAIGLFIKDALNTLAHL